MPGLVLLSWSTIIYVSLLYCSVAVVICGCLDLKNLCPVHGPRLGDFCAHGSSIGCACLSCVNMVIGAEGFALMSEPTVSSSLAGGKECDFPPMFMSMNITVICEYKTSGMMCIVKLFCNCWTSLIKILFYFPSVFPFETPCCVVTSPEEVLVCSVTCSLSIDQNGEKISSISLAWSEIKTFMSC